MDWTQSHFVIAFDVQSNKSNHLLWHFLLLLAITTSHGWSASATFTGTLDPSSNANLTYWDTLSNMYASPLAGPTDAERAYNIALHTFIVSVASSLTFESTGYSLGGFDSVVSVFAGTGDSAMYIDHQYNPISAGDFSFTENLIAGTYTLAIAMFGSQPCAPGLCVGATNVFGDGFNNLANYDESRTLLYSVTVTTPDEPVPEASTWNLFSLAAGFGLLARRIRWSSAHGCTAVSSTQ